MPKLPEAYDVIGDVHGCCGELLLLLQKLGCTPDGQGGLAAPAGRKLVFVGDLCDRGPLVDLTLSLVMRLVDNGQAWAVLGNHDDRLLRGLLDHKVGCTHGYANSILQLQRSGVKLPEYAQSVAQQFRQAGITAYDSPVLLDDLGDWGRQLKWPSYSAAHYSEFLASLPYYLELDQGRLIVAHAGFQPELAQRSSRAIKAFCLYGDVDKSQPLRPGDFPVRRNWFEKYQGSAAIVYGHTPVTRPQWVNNTIDIDSGCVFGGALTALRWPERELVVQPALQTYWKREGFPEPS